MLKPEGSRIVAVERSYRCEGCHRPGVVVTLQRVDSKQVQAWTHDDGSFVEWLGDSDSSA